MDIRIRYRASLRTGSQELVPNRQTSGPKVSVVTINRNMSEGLQTTLKSVTAQTYENLEFLVIDGASIDGSTELIRSFASEIDYWVSEPDEGIYDAMNKGVRAATGEWVIFMNAGDRFHDNDAIADVFRQSHADADLVYGHSVCWYPREKIERVVPAEAETVLPLRMNCSHQSLFARRSLLIESPFSLEFIASDYEFLVRMYVEGRRFKEINRIIGVKSTGGISDVRRIRSLSERARIATGHGLMTPRRALSYFSMTLRAGLGFYAKRALPSKITEWIMKRNIVH
jgi:glycosyltransferase involved in cell wall biosynthesis